MFFGYTCLPNSCSHSHFYETSCFFTLSVSWQLYVRLNRLQSDNGASMCSRFRFAIYSLVSLTFLGFFSCLSQGFFRIDIHVFSIYVLQFRLQNSLNAMEIDQKK
uniref:Uncharacterized protein n=1 Tax=Arundo donax TaxID=35708 RepID=A0A0A8YJA6_ARUDO